MKTVTYRGWLVLAPWGEAEDILYLTEEPEHLKAGMGEYMPLAERIENDMSRHGRYLSVRYFTSKEEQSIEELTGDLIDTMAGVGEADVGAHYSEITGYLWTDEEINVGGHSLIGRLRGHTGEFCHLEIGYSKEPHS